MDCERQYYVNIDYRPYLFYVVFGADRAQLRISKQKHRVSSIPAGLDVMVINSAEHKKYMDALIGGDLAEKLRNDDPMLFEQCMLESSWAILKGEVKADATLDYLRDAVGIVQALCETGAVGVLDLQTKTLTDCDDFAEKVFKNAVDPYAHVKLFKANADDGTVWLHTTGMSKLGRPDLSVWNIAPDAVSDAAEIISQLIWFSAQGAFTKDEMRLTVKSGKAYVFEPEYHAESENFDRGYFEIDWKSIKQ